MGPEMSPPTYPTLAANNPAKLSLWGRYGETVVAAVLTGIFTAAGGWVVGWYFSDKSAEKVVREAERAKIELVHASRELADLQPKYSTLRAGLANLTGKYEACTNVHGSVVQTPVAWQSFGPVQLATADTLRAGLAASDLQLRLVRVTNQGAVVRIEGCAKPGLSEGRTSDQDGPNAFVLPQGSKIHIQASTQCCEKGLHDCDVADLEEFTLDCRRADVASQVAEIAVKRSLIGHAGS
jgi:hypothetical protein